MRQWKRYLATASIRMSYREIPPNADILISAEAKITSRIRMEGDISLSGPVRVKLITDSEGTVERALVETTTDLEHLPTFTTSADGPHSLVVPPDPRADELTDVLGRLEGLLFPLGAVEIHLATCKWSWFAVDRGSREKRLVFAIEAGLDERPIPAPRVPASRIEHLVRHALSGEKDRETLTLNLFREGESHFQSARYQDSIRYFLLAIEHQFGGGKFREAQIKEQYAKSPALIQAIAGARNLLGRSIASGDVRASSLDELLPEDSDAVIDRLISTRGFLFHQSSTRRKNWHRFQQIPHKE